MVILAAILLYFLAPPLMLLIWRLRPRLSYQWLIAMFTSLLAWVLVIASRTNLAQSIPLPIWSPENIFSISPVILLDPLSWSFALAIASLSLANILSAVARLEGARWNPWANSLLLCGISLVAVLAGNPLTILIGWGIMDIIELIITFRQTDYSAYHQRAVYLFGARTAGTLILFAGLVHAWYKGISLDYPSIPITLSLYFILAAAVRLGVIPPQLPVFQEPPYRRGMGTILRLAPAASSFVLLARSAQTGALPETLPWMTLLIAFGAVFGSIAWIIAKDELHGRGAWLVGIASMACLSAVRGQPLSTQAWGLAALLSGGIIFMASPRHKYLYVLLALGLLGITALPFTPTWNGAQLYDTRFLSGNLIVHLLSSLLFLLTHSLLMLGFLRHMLQPVETPVIPERWIWLIYPLGMLFVNLNALILSWLYLPSLAEISLIQWSAGFAAVGIAALIWFSLTRGQNQVDQSISTWKDRSLKWIRLLEWIYQPFRLVYRAGGKFIEIVGDILQGEGGILWALVLLVLLVTFLMNR